MAETIFTEALERLCVTEGSAQAVATLLRVPEKTLERWRAGRAQIPVRAFEEVMRILTAQEMSSSQSAVSHVEMPDQIALTYRAVMARCQNCESTSFRPAIRSTALRYSSQLACCRCGKEAVHADLILALAREVSVYARSRIVRAQLQRGRQQASLAKRAKNE